MSLGKNEKAVEYFEKSMKLNLRRFPPESAMYFNAALSKAFMAGGTDGEDGPTDAAGAILDASILSAANRLALDPADYLARNDAYHFFEPLGGLIKAGPTHTNVCDVRVVVVDRIEAGKRGHH